MSANFNLHSVPDAIDPVVGWRTWRISQMDDGLRLTSVAYNQQGMFWPVRERFAAECRTFYNATKKEHFAPYRPCNCGIYAAKEVSGARGYVNPFTALGENVAWLAIGRVFVWGHMIEHEDGYRAQYAYPKQILLPDEISNKQRKVDAPNLIEIAAEIRDTYGVPVLIVHPKKPSLLDRIKGAC